ncbi:hypothetical protein [Cupriavidus pauculus]|uniref:hypothetical protein n=1 Tax=Cupriavidus pauculus TaxID=82633 RepID=UPI001245AC60|nr:hypothetical protein [Cupriavidus pauculus]KAB0596024.1 hypothetical protein F7R19_27925 [Cupriavidus pauculus]MCM3608225.1 hypothetical protein [Cupriavidus pauculus]UAL00377.1 hypothetical protein K8O84_03090 [Cupriavidus pauculus]
MFGFEKFSVSAWVEGGITKQPKAVSESTSKRRSGAWKVVASLLLAAAASTSAVSMASSAEQTAISSDGFRMMQSSAGVSLRQRVGDQLLTVQWRPDASQLLAAGVVPTMSDEVRAMALQAIEAQKLDADDDVESWARSLVEGMFS